MMFRRNVLAVVLGEQVQLVVLYRVADLDPRLVCAALLFDRVRQQVVKHLANMVPIACDYRHLLLNIDRNPRRRQLRHVRIRRFAGQHAGPYYSPLDRLSPDSADI
jgi:hypothetical protein